MENENWPASVQERIAPYAERMKISEAEAYQQFADFLSKEFSVTEPLEEDEFYLSQWAEQFVIETRNLGPSGGGSGRETETFVGHVLGVDEYINDLRSKQMERAKAVWNHSSNQAIDEKIVGVVTAKDGRWHVNGEVTGEEVKGDELPWFGFEHDGRILCLLNQNQASPSLGKPMAPKSLMRTLYFLGNEESKFESSIKLWRVGLQGADMEVEYEIGAPCRIQVTPPKEGSDNLYTNRGFAKTVVYTDDFVPENMRVELRPERYLVNDRVHNEFVELDDLIEAYDERKVPNNSGGYYAPYIITKGYVSRMNREPNNSEYDQTGRSFRMSITSLALQSSFGRDSSLSEVSVWVPGRVYDDTHPFEFKENDEWLPYAERTQVIVFGRLRLRPFNGQDVPSVTAYGVYVPPRTARPGAVGGDTSLEQFGGNE